MTPWDHHNLRIFMPTRKIEDLPARVTKMTIDLYDAIINRFQSLVNYQEELRNREKEYVKAGKLLDLTEKDLDWKEENLSSNS